ncbi:MAG: hypothetical protein PHR21_05220 [Oscillospiraceae bacterium]|nr:hypothetical protein [Oscillospiraceae bacterium]MDD4368010.1 hypothetical protein [Oscillospiraceae bacterium]
MKNHSDKAKSELPEQQPAEWANAADLYEPVFWSEDEEEDAESAAAALTGKEDPATVPAGAVAASSPTPPEPAAPAKPAAAAVLTNAARAVSDQTQILADQTQIRAIRRPAVRPMPAGETAPAAESVSGPDSPSQAKPPVARLDDKAAVRPGINNAGVAPSQTQSVSLTGWRQNASTFLKQNLLHRKPNGRKPIYKPLKYRGVSSRLRRQGPNKIYRLKGYTTVTRVNRKRRRERLKRHTHNLISFAVIILALILLFIWLNPLPRLQDLLHALGFSE